MEPPAPNPSIMTFTRFALLITLYAGVITVIAGLVSMEAPKELWGDETLPVSPAVGGIEGEVIIFDNETII